MAAYDPHWWLLKITPERPAWTADHLDRLFPKGVGSAGKAGIGTWDGCVTKPWHEMDDREKATLTDGARVAYHLFCDEMQAGDRVVVAAGTQEIHALLEVASPEKYNWAPDGDKPDWFTCFRRMGLLERFAPPLRARRMSRKALVHCALDLRDLVLDRSAVPADALTWHEREDLAAGVAPGRVMTRIERRRDQKRAARRRAAEKHLCELCRRASFETRSGEPYCEVHHIIPLGAGGWDTEANIAVLCAEHHREVHCGAKAGDSTTRLRRLPAHAGLSSLAAERGLRVGPR